MGIDLDLLPLDGDFGTWGFSHTILRCGVGGWWVEVLDGIPTTDVPADFTSFLGRGSDGEHRYGQTKTTAYDEPLRCARAGDIVARMDMARAKYPEGARVDVTVQAYLRALPSDRRVALYWH